MLGILGKSKRDLSTIIVDHMNKQKGVQNVDNVDGLNLAANDIITAFKSGDAEMLKVALKNFIYLCDNEHEENEME